MRAVRFTRLEAQLLTELIGPALTADSLKARKIASVIAAKLVAANTPKPAKGTPIREAIDAFRRALGNRLVVPPSSAAALYASMQRRLSDLGIGAADCYEVARIAAVVWEGSVRAESLVRQADKLLGSDEQPKAAAGSPVTLGDDEL